MNSLPFRIIEGVDVDVITPFPNKEIDRAISWAHCYKTYITDDFGPQTDEEFKEYFKQQLSSDSVLTYAIIDKHNRTSRSAEVPLIGIIVFNLTSPATGYIHVLTSRKAWGTKIRQGKIIHELSRPMIDEAGELVLKDLFDQLNLLRVNAYIVKNNTAARALLKRMQFTQDGYFKSGTQVNGQPVDLLHFGLVREDYYAICSTNTRDWDGAIVPGRIESKK